MSVVFPSRPVLKPPALFLFLACPSVRSRACICVRVHTSVCVHTSRHDREPAQMRASHVSSREPPKSSLSGRNNRIEPVSEFWRVLRLFSGYQQHPRPPFCKLRVTLGGRQTSAADCCRARTAGSVDRAVLSPVLAEAACGPAGSVDSGWSRPQFRCHSGL